MFIVNFYKMDSFEINKIIAAVLMVALLVIGIGKISGIIFHVEKPKTPGYVVEVEEIVNASSSTAEITEKKVEEVRDLAYSNDDLYEIIMNNMYDRGIWVENDPREPWFLCEAHTDEVIDHTLNIFEESVKASLK